MSDFIKELKKQVNIADVIGEYVRLRKTGSNHMGLCPFHAERSPSFSVAEKKGIYHCFGCQRGGDVISFVQEIQGVSFPEAIQILAYKFKIPLPADWVNQKSNSSSAALAKDAKLEVYYKLNRFVADFYHGKLLSEDGKGAKAYLGERGINADSIKSAYLGYAPGAWGQLVEFLTLKKAPLDKAEELGLIRKKDDHYYDMFRNRIIFPVLDTRGRVIAFGGRILNNASEKTEGPKYLNSSESPVYKKGNSIFGIFYAQKDIRAQDSCVIVEGFMDCISLQQAGVHNTVATLGTALTDHQIALIKRLTRNIIMLFDGDVAGQEAQSKAMELFLNHDIVVRGIALPDANDPDDFVKSKGVNALNSELQSAPYLLDQRILELAAQAGSSTETRSRAVDQVLPWLAKITSDTARMVRLQELAHLFDINLTVLEKRLAEIRRGAPGSKPEAQRGFAVRPNASLRPKQNLNIFDTLDVRLVELLVLFPRLRGEIKNADQVLNGLESEVLKACVRKQLSAGQDSLQEDELMPEVDSPALKAILTKALVEKDDKQEGSENILGEFNDLITKLTRRGLEKHKESLRAVILKADGSGQSNEMNKLMSEYNELARSLERPLRDGDKKI